MQRLQIETIVQINLSGFGGTEDGIPGGYKSKISNSRRKELDDNVPT